MPSEAERERAYETLAVANTAAPLEPAEVGYIELVASPDPRIAPAVFALEHVKVRLGRFSTEGTYATSPDVYVAIRADATAISPMNTMFEYVAGEFHVFDTRSTNGTFVNGQQIRKRRPLAAGDVIDIGGTPADGGARVVFLGRVAPPGREIRRAPGLTRHTYISPRRVLAIEIDSATGQGTAAPHFGTDEWHAAFVDIATRVARIASPHLPATTAGDTVAYATGGPLAPIVARHLYDLRTAGAIVADLCDLAAACHAARPPILIGPFTRGLVFTRPDGRAVLFGAGIARLAYDCGSGMRGAMMLAHHFVRSPEELGRGDIGPATDVWHAAGFLVDLMTDAEPFPTDDMTYVTAVLGGDAHVPPGVPAAIAQALAPDPRARPSLRALAAALRR